MRPGLTLSVISFLISFFVYRTILNNSSIALAIMLTLLIHEIGHIIGFIIKKYKWTLPIFTPVGAIVGSSKIRNPNDEAFTAYLGPFFGMMASVVLFFWAVKNPEHSYFELALLTSHISAFINFLNLIPVKPLDGGIVINLVSKKLKYLGFFLLSILTILGKSIFFAKSPIEPIDPFIFILFLISLLVNNMTFSEKFFVVLMLLLVVGIKLYLNNSMELIFIKSLLIRISPFLLGVIFWPNRKNNFKVNKKFKHKWVFNYLSLCFILISLIVAQLYFINQSDISLVNR